MVEVLLSDILKVGCVIWFVCVEVDVCVMCVKLFMLCNDVFVR